LIGQPQAIALLGSAIVQDRIAPAYLFAGPAGVGRKVGAIAFSSLLLAKPSQAWELLQSRIRQHNHPDLLWVEPTYLHQGKRLTVTEAEEQGVKRKAPPQIRLEQVREITQFLSRPPLEAPRSVVILEDAETMAEAAANALLKTLEEPGRATLILIATSPDALLPTLVSRCQQIPFRRLDPEAIAPILSRAQYQDILQHPDVLALAQGSPGEAIAHWLQLQAIPADLLQELQQGPQSLRQGLEMARRVTQTLDTEMQLWLLEYLQNYIWQTQRNIPLLHQMEEARRQLLRYVQPRLVWEVLGMRWGRSQS
jgi:DNA polymerase-3 subunit delta'